MRKYTIIIIATALVAITGIIYTQQNSVPQQTKDTSNKSTIHSPYAGQETRRIKALSQKDIDGLLAGSGTPFGGLAKPAELNGYPGPRHVLDAIEAGEFEVTTEQKKEIEKLYAGMKSQAVALGEQIIAMEQDIDDAFSGGTMTESYLQEKITESAELYGQLRIVHLKHHFPMMDILSPEQVAAYNELRGYTSDGDPCKNIPAGHDPEMWKLNNNCE